MCKQKSEMYEKHLLHRNIVSNLTTENIKDFVIYTVTFVVNSECTNNNKRSQSYRRDIHKYMNECDYFFLSRYMKLHLLYFVLYCVTIHASMCAHFYSLASNSVRVGTMDDIMIMTILTGSAFSGPTFVFFEKIITTIFVSKYSVRGSTTTRTTTTTIAHVCCSFEQYLFYDYKWKTSETRVMTPHAVFIVGYFFSFENLINKINDHRKFNVHNKTQIINTLILSAYDSKVLTIYNSLLLQCWSLSQNPDPMSEWVSEWRVSVYYLSPLSWEKTNDYHMWEYTSRIDLSIWLHVERWKQPIRIEQKHGRKDVNCSFAGSLCLSICLLVCFFLWIYRFVSLCKLFPCI